MTSLARTPSTSTKSAIPLYRTLLEECHSVESNINPSHLFESLGKLHSFLQDTRSDHSDSCSSSTDEPKPESESGPQQKNDTKNNGSERCDDSECASSLLRLHVVRTFSTTTTAVATTTTEQEIVMAIDRCLDLCGHGTTFEAAVDILRTLTVPAETGNRRVDAAAGAAAAAPVLRTLRRLLFATVTNDDENASNKKDDGGFLILLREYVAYDPRLGDHTGSHPVTRKRRIQSFVDVTLRLPVLVASACYVAKVRLPRWAVRSRYFTNLVERSASLVFLAGSRGGGGGGEGAIKMVGDDEDLQEETTYFVSLVKRMVHHGGTDDVALGFHRFYIKHKLTNSHNSDNDKNECPKSLDTLRCAMRHVASCSPPRECAALLRSVHRYAVAEVVKKGVDDPIIEKKRWDRKVTDTSVQDGVGIAGKETLWYLIEICREVLQSFEVVRDEFVRSMVLSPVPRWGLSDSEDGSNDDFDDDIVVAKTSVGSGNEWRRGKNKGRGKEVEQRVVTQFVVLLLASCGNIGFDSDDDDDDNNNSSDTGDDSFDNDEGDDTYRSHKLEIKTSEYGKNCLPERKSAPKPPPSSLRTTLSSDTSYATLIRHLQETALLWSEPTFIHRTDPPRQRQVTRFLIDALPYLSSSVLSRSIGDHDRKSKGKGRVDYDEDTRRQQSTVEHLIAGVTNRLRITGNSVRVDGMVVAERLAPLLGNQELKFEELDQMRTKGGNELEGLEGTLKLLGDGKDSKGNDASGGDDEVGSGTNEGKTMTEILKEQRSKSSTKKKKKKKAVVDIDPDEEYSSASGEEEVDDSIRSSSSSEKNNNSSCYSSDSEWDEDELLAYDAPDSDDEEDLLLVPKPNYLRDCLDLLRAEGDDLETLVRHRTGLIALPTLVRALPPDLPDLSVTLVRQLLNMENRFDVEGFEGYVWDSLCALIVCDAASGEVNGGDDGGCGVVGCLVRELFNGGYSLGTRLEILDAMRYGSSELCGSVELKLQSAVRKREETSNERNRVTVTGKRGIVPIETIKDASLDLKQVAQNAVGNLAKTRRWGRNRHGGTPPTVTNRFGPLAPFFFYPLVQGFAATKFDPALWGGDNGGRLLSRLLVTLSCFIYDMGSYPGTTEVLAADLFELAWSFYGAENPEVRIAVLVALATAVPFLGRGRLAGLLISEGSPFSGGGRGTSNGVIESLHATKLSDTNGECRRLASAILNSFSAERDVW